MLCENFTVFWGSSPDCLLIVRWNRGLNVGHSTRAILLVRHAKFFYLSV